MEFKWGIVRRQSYTQEGGKGYAYIDPFAGDSDIAHIHSVYVPEKDRGQGIGDAQHKERLEFLRNSGFSWALCTANSHNDPEIKILEKNGWEKIKELEYSSIWIKDLREQAEDVKDA
jgi:ribosomal protein S18 acetylase RimI-like enzyme